MKDELRIISTEEELKVFSDPYRLKIIKAYQELGKPSTVKQIADHLGEVPAKVHYHVKKLLGINILELDHVEVINGINAKYYIMPKKSFSVQIKDEENSDLYSQLNHVEQMLSNMIEAFKKDMLTSSQKAVENKIQKESEVGMMTAKDLYLTEEEYVEVSKILADLTEKYGKYDETKNQYSYLGGLSKRYKKE